MSFMSKEQIQARIKELETNRDQAQATYIACVGAIQELTSWLDKVEVKEEH